MSYEKNVGALLFGTLLGVGLGMLFAPEKGSVTRQKIADNAASARDNVSSEAEHLKNALVSKSNELRNSMANSFSTNKQSFEERLDSLLTDASYKTDDVIDKLEDQLKALKAKNKKLRTKAKS